MAVATAPRMTKKMLREELEALMTASPSSKGEAWKPTPFGEHVAVTLIETVCKTARPHDGYVKAYTELEDGPHALDHLMNEFRDLIVNHVHAALAR